MYPSLQNTTPLSIYLFQQGNASTDRGSVPEGWPGQKKHLALAGWQQQWQRHSAATLQQPGQTRLNPAGTGMCSEKHWPGIWDVRLTLLNDSLATMSIRATLSSLFDITVKESGATVGGGRKKGKTRTKGLERHKSLNCQTTCGCWKGRSKSARATQVT